MDMPATVPLHELETGRTARVARLDLRPSESQRLMEMGLTVGAAVTLAKRAPLGDPVEIAVRGCHLSIRRSIAQAIHVEPMRTS
jgi:ferrous iron transport protein A